MAAAGAALRLRLLYRMLRAGEVLALVAFVSWTSTYVPSAVAAALRLAGSLLLNARFVFLLGNAIVLLLFVLSRHDLSSSSSSSTDDEHQPAATDGAATAAAATVPAAQQVPPVPVAAGFASFTTTPPTTTLPSDTTVLGSSSLTTPPAAAMEELAPRRRDQALPLAAFEPRVVTTVFEDKPATATVRVSKARAPRRLRSEKMMGGARRAASPELRRCESENGGRRRRSSVTARDAEACWGREDADEFRRTVEAFIARQTRFHREESIKISSTMAVGHCEAAPAFTGALAVVE